MTIHIIASGETAGKWDGIGPSIGVNDAWKWGYPTDYLILLNIPGQFQPSRLEVIKSSKPRKLYTNVPASWKNHFDHIETITPLRRWSAGEPVKQSIIYHSKTSPFVAISLAYSWGFNQVVLWGVDMVTHQRYGHGQSGHVQEMMKYQTYIKALKDKGVRVVIGSRGTAFDNILPVWDKEKSLQ